MSIYKPSLLDKFKDFVNGLKSNWNIFEAHLAEYSSLKGEITYKIYYSTTAENKTITLPDIGNYLCAIGHGIAGQGNAGALYFLSYWSTQVYGVSPIVESSRYTVTLSSDGVVTVEGYSTWMMISLTKLS